MKVITLLILFLFSASSWTQNITLTAVSEVWPQFANPEDDKQGFIIEVAREAFESQGYDLVVNFVPWTRALDNMRNDKADILIAAWYSAERNSYLYFSQPIVQSPVRFLKRKEDPFEFKDLDSLTGLRIGTILNYQYQEEFCRQQTLIA